MNHRTLILGHNGFIGKNLLTIIPNSLQYSNRLLNTSSIVDLKLFILKNDINVVINALSPNNPFIDSINIFNDLQDVKFVHLCSASILKSSEFALSETSPKLPVSQYGILKYSDYLKFIKFCDKFSDCLILRPSTVIGPRMNRSQLFGRIYHEVVELGLSEIAVSNLNIFRDYICVNDLSHFIYDILNNNITNTEINIGSGSKTSSDLLIDSLLNYKNIIRVQEESKFKHNIDCSFFDVSKLRNIIGRSPSFNISEAAPFFWGKNA